MQPDLLTVGELMRAVAISEVLPKFRNLNPKGALPSIDLENAAVGHPAVAEACVIGVLHEKWDERPLLLVVKVEGKDLSKEEILAFLEDKVAKWWLPNDVIFVSELPHTATGKLLKTNLRDEYKEHLINTGK